MLENKPVRLAPDEYLQKWCPWLETAQRLIGLREIPGQQHEAMILTMWQKIGAAFRDDETPWCAAFAGYCLEDHGFPSTRSAAALSYAKWGREIVYRPTDLQDVALGAITVLNRPGSAWSGHVGFFVKPTIFTGPDEPGVVLLGGNQDNQVKLSSFRLSRVKNFRWPIGFNYPPARSPFVGAWLAAQSRSEA